MTGRAVGPSPAGGGDPVRAPETASVPQRGKRAWILLALTLLVPGGAQVVAGDRRLGRAALRVTLAVWAVLLAALVLFLVQRDLLLRLAADPTWQLGGIIVLAALAIGWAVLWVDTLRLVRLRLLAPGMRPLVAACSVLALVATSGVLGYGSWAVNAGRNALGSIFEAGPAIEPVDGRYNFLLMGGDAGEGRLGLRPDSIHVASMNARTGHTIVFSLPRNFQNAQFTEDSPLWQAYPEGFDCGDECILNALYVDVNENHRDLYPDAEDPGAEAMKDAAGGILGLEVQSYALVDMGGFAQLIDAMGGVTVTSGGWTTYRGTRPDGQWGNAWWGPGTYTFDGEDALAFARSRHFSTDYSRIRRQQCIQSAMLAQFNPQTLVTRFQGILDAGEQIVETDLPGQQLGTFVGLASKARSQEMGQLTIGPPDFGSQGDQFTTYPDFELVHQRVGEMLAEDGTPQAAGGMPAPLLVVDAAAGVLAGAAPDPAGSEGSGPADWPEPPRQPDGDPIDPEWLMYLEDTGQIGLLEEAAKTNHLCVAGTG
ncbi:LytR family transcriptional regulator [Citricoccus sp. SGAir0253]|uniref:LCP family protein n=1 Tax=Citricoccus sp. SGAir0253 TaxID=2567881 RepID=UPI0010CD0054|nr:LCP family protein [Citricoccus sp. SGAir0253]QCU78648.1 LytR family transcriptional regulator [Citricoccus sp. SGAir0253]